MHHCRAGGPGTQPPDDQAAHHRGASHRRKPGGDLRDHRPDDLLRRDACRGKRLPHRQGDIRRTGGPPAGRQFPARTRSARHPKRLRASVSPGERRRLRPGGPGPGRSPAPATQRRINRSSPPFPRRQGASYGRARPATTRRRARAAAGRRPRTATKRKRQATKGQERAG